MEESTESRGLEERGFWNIEKNRENNACVYKREDTEYYL